MGYSSSVTDNGSGSGGPTDIGNGGSQPQCGYVPSSCNSDLNWAVSSGIYQHSEYYPDFQSVTGKALTSATYDDMVLYFHCNNVNPRGNCNGLQAPCGRSCGGSSSSSCGYVPDSCSGDLKWAAETGTKTHSEWYPDFQSITGASLSAATEEDVQLFWVCKGWYQNGDCDGMQAPCGRSCNSAFTEEDESASNNNGNKWVWIVVGLTLTMALVLCVVLMVYVLRNNKPVVMSDDDGIKLKDDQQIQETDDRMIELEDSIEKMDGDVPTIEVTA